LVRHPSLAETVHPVVSLSAKILATIGGGGSEASLRQSLALLVVPLAAAGRTLIMLTLFHQLPRPAFTLLTIVSSLALLNHTFTYLSSH
jgi:hypothetical protein